MAAKKFGTHHPYLPGFPADSLPTEVAPSRRGTRPPNGIESSVTLTDDYSRGYDALSALIEDIVPEDRNEAATRLQVIDRILFECLGWTKENCLPEDPHGGEYADYVLLCPYKTAIIEAKREGRHFLLPISKSGAHIRDIPALLKSCSELRDAAQQVAKYCQDRGVPFAAVTNGSQLVAFIGSRNDGVPPLEGKALVFDSLERLLKHFLVAWNCLSPEGIARGGLNSLLLEQDQSLPPAKISSKIPNYPGYKQRNDLQADLEIVSDLVFNDISESRTLEEEFINECYCKSGALSQHSNLTRSILEARYAKLFVDDQPKPVQKPALDKKGIISTDLIAEGMAKRPIVLVGDVGAGKTSFLRKLIKVDAKDILRNSITLYIDLGRSATLETVRDFLVQEIPRQLRDSFNFDIFERNTVRGIYHNKLEEFGRGIFSDLKEIDPSEFKKKEIEHLEKLTQNKAEHIRHSLMHLSKGRKQQITIVLDNCDQRDERDQQEAFLISEEMATSWECLVFVTLRPETFNRSRKKGALTGYHPKVFTISPPRTELMLDKRLAFAQKICRGEIQLESISSLTRFSKLLSFLDVVRSSLRSNRELSIAITNIAGGNMRMALDLLQSFISSGHINSAKILGIHERERRYTIATHEFLRAIIFSDHQYYDPSASPITNIFQQWTNDKRENFIILHLISSLTSIGESGGADGFVEYPRLVDAIQQLGYTPSQISTATHFCLNRKLIEAAGRLIPEVKQDSYPGLRITSLGKYHLNSLSKMFTYFDAILCDMRNIDDQIGQRVAYARSLPDRLKCAAEFLNLFHEVWTSDSPEHFGSLGWPEIKASLEADMGMVAKRSALQQDGPRKA